MKITLPDSPSDCSKSPIPPVSVAARDASSSPSYLKTRHKQTCLNAI